MGTREVFIVDGIFRTPDELKVHPDLFALYYGRIEWEECNFDPKKGLRKLPAPIINALCLLDSINAQRFVVPKVKYGIYTASILDRERDDLYERVLFGGRIAPYDGFIFTKGALNYAIAKFLNIDVYKAWAIDHVCSSGLDVISLAFSDILKGEIDIAFVCTINSMASIMRTSYHRVLKVVSKSGKVKPFDVDRDGTIFADGIAVSIIVSGDILRKFGLDPLAKIKSCANIADSYHMFSLEETGRGFRLVMEEAIEKAGIGRSEISVIKAHATATKMNDAVEARAIAEVFASSFPVVTAFKGRFGHSVTSSGLIETLFVLKYIKEKSFIPQIYGLEQPDPSCAHINLAGEPVRYEGGYVLSLSAGFGGFFSAAIFDL